jgi:hypothetical protein
MTSPQTTQYVLDRLLNIRTNSGRLLTNNEKERYTVLSRRFSSSLNSNLISCRGSKNSRELSGRITPRQNQIRVDGVCTVG